MSSTTSSRNDLRARLAANNARYEAAKKHFDEHEYKEALAILDELLDRAPTNVLYLDSKGAVLCALYQHEEAVELFDKSIGLNGERHFPYQGKAGALSGLSLREKALETYDQALERSKNASGQEAGKAESEVLSGKAYVLLASGKLDEALQLAEKAVGLKPDAAGPWCAKGECMSRLGGDREREALECYQKAEEIDAKNASVFNGRGHIFLKQANACVGDEEATETKKAEATNKMRAAEQQFDKSLELKPKYAEALCGKGSCLLLAARLEPARVDELEARALELLDRAVEIKPDYPEAHQQRATIVRKKLTREFDAQYGVECRMLKADAEFVKEDVERVAARLVPGCRVIDSGAGISSGGCFLHQKANKQWVALCVASGERGRKAEVLFKDSRGGRVPLELEEALRGALGPETVFKSHCIAEQTRDKLSGPMALNNVRLMSEGVARSPGDYAKYFLGARFTSEGEVPALKCKYQTLAYPDLLGKLESYVADLANNDKFLKALAEATESLRRVASFADAAFAAATARPLPDFGGGEKDEVDYFRQLGEQRPKVKPDGSADEIKSRTEKLERLRNKHADEFFKLERVLDIIARMRGDAEADALLQSISGRLQLDYGLIKSLYQQQQAQQESAPAQSDAEASDFFLKPQPPARSTPPASVAHKEEEEGVKPAEQLMSELVLGTGEGSEAGKAELASSLSAAKAQCRAWSSRSEADLLVWANAAKEGGGSGDVAEAIGVMNRANSLVTGGHQLRDTQIIALLAFLTTRAGQGRLCEIKTGEGKTTIVACLAAIKALQGGRTVDIITSNPVLAQEGVDDKAAFYSLLGLSVATNNTDDKASAYTSGAKQCYTADVVYGAISSFQFDFLRDSFDGLGTRAGRPFDTVILDEVDSMLIDNGGHIAKISGPLPGMEALRYIYIRIWDALTSLLSGGKDSKPSREDLKAQLGDLAEERALLPAHLLAFCDARLDQWIGLALHAAFECHEDEQYVIRTRGEDGEARAVPVDYANTGITLKNTIWSHGLHQFVQLKHGLQLTAESLTSNFISNLGYICKYGDRIYGLTGTLGSVAEQQLLSAVYSVDYAKVSTYKSKRFDEMPGLVSDDANWAMAVVVDVLYQTDRGRAALVVCETIKDLQRVRAALDSVRHIGGGGSVKVRIYADEEDAQETKARLEAGHVVLSTNIAGRGTDFKTSPEVERAGGLYVCVGFLPCNKRVEDQAFGRTARQGNVGSARLVMRNTELGGGIPINADFELVKEVRDRVEAERVADIRRHKVAELGFQDALFAEFTRLYRGLSDGSEEADSVSQYALDDLKEAWAYWLERQKYDAGSGASKAEAEASARARFQEFCSSVSLDKLRKGEIVFNPYYAIRKADAYLAGGGNSNQARQALENALALGGNNPDVLHAAHVKLFELTIQSADVMTKQFKNTLEKVFAFSRSEIDGAYKKEAAEHLEKALKGVRKEMDYMDRHLFGSPSAQSPPEPARESAPVSMSQPVTPPPPSTPADSSKTHSSSSSSSRGTTGPSPFVRHMQSRYQCLAAMAANVEALHEELKASDDRKNFALKSCVREFLLKLMNNGGGGEELDAASKQLRDGITRSEVLELSAVGMSTSYQLKPVFGLKNEIAIAIEAQILTGAGMLLVCLFWPPAAPALLPVASTLIAEGVVDIVVALISGGESDPDFVNDYLKGKAISYGVSFLTLGLSAVATSLRLLNAGVRGLQKLSTLLARSPMMKKMCDAAIKMAGRAIAARNLPAALLTRGQMLRQVGVAVGVSVAGAAVDELAVGPILNAVVQIGQKRAELKQRAKETMAKSVELRPIAHLKPADVLHEAEAVLQGDFTRDVLDGIASGVCRHYSKKTAALSEYAKLASDLYNFVDKFCAQLGPRLKNKPAEPTTDPEPVLDQLAEMAVDKMVAMVTGFLKNAVQFKGPIGRLPNKSRVGPKDVPHSGAVRGPPSGKIKETAPEAVQKPVYLANLDKIINKHDQASAKFQPKLAPRQHDQLDANAAKRMSVACGPAAIQHLTGSQKHGLPNANVSIAEFQKGLQRATPGVKYEAHSNLPVEGVHGRLHRAMNQGRFDEGVLGYNRREGGDGHLINVRRGVNERGKPVLYGVDSNGKRIHDLEGYLKRDGAKDVVLMTPSRAPDARRPIDLETGFGPRARFGARKSFSGEHVSRGSGREQPVARRTRSQSGSFDRRQSVRIREADEARVARERAEQRDIKRERAAQRRNVDNPHARKQRADLNHGREANREFDRALNEAAGFHLRRQERTERAIPRDFPDWRRGEHAGGQYAALDSALRGRNQLCEVNHMPAENAYRRTRPPYQSMDRTQMPCVTMDYADHRDYITTGSSAEAARFRKIQSDFLRKGRFDLALELDIRAMKECFGTKYDHGMRQMLNTLKEPHNQHLISPSQVDRLLTVVEGNHLHIWS